MLHKCETSQVPNSPAQRRALIIACAFPPTGGSGVQRPAKFAKYLTHLGWKVDVWSGHNLPGLPRDASLLLDLPDELTLLGINVWRLFAAGKMSFAQRIVSSFLRHISFPDERMEWVLRSVFRLYKRLLRSPVDVIVATYSPPSNLFLAWCISRLTGTPWIADFRDLWTDDCTYAPHTRLRRWMDANLETRLLRSADAVVGVSTAQTRILASHVPLEPEKFHTLTNGVDFDDFKRLHTPTSSPERFAKAPRECASELPLQYVEHPTPACSNDSNTDRRLVLTHVGRLERQRFSESILNGFKQFAATCAEAARWLRLHLVGHVNPGLLDDLRESGLGVFATGELAHAASLRSMVSSDWLLLPTAQGCNAESLIPGKTFEYLASGRPIWVLGCPTAEVWRRISELHAGRLCDPSSQSVSAGLKELVAEWQAGQTPNGCPRQALQCYGRDTIAARLSQLMESVIATQHRAANKQPRGAVSAEGDGTRGQYSPVVP